MDPRDPSQRPSIFTKPEPNEERKVPEPDGRPDFWHDPPMTRHPAESEPVAQPGPSRRLVMGLSFGGALLLLVIGGLVAAALLGPDEDPAIGATSPSATASATVRPSISPTPAATASPTPVPTPAGPPQEIPVGAWATVAVDELNVRSAAGIDSISNRLLVRGAVVHVAEGPTIVAGLNWYRIASLGGAVGWVTSGWVAEPFMTTLVDDPTLIRCGKVGRSVFDVSDGVATPHDPVAIGDLALPAGAFSDLSLGAIELLRGVGSEACFSAEVMSDGLPAIRTQLAVTACGHAVAEGDHFRLRPAVQNVSVESQVKDPVVVHPAILVGGPPEDRKSSNLRAMLTMMANGDDATGCIHLNVTEDVADRVEAFRAMDSTQCSIVHEYNADSLRLSPAAGGETVWIKLTSGGSQPGIFQLEVPVPVAVNANATDAGRGAYAYQGYDPACG